MSGPLRHHSLVAYQRADDLYIHLHQLADKSFPRSEQYGLTSQLRRAAYSVPANIVEGFARLTVPDRLRFLQIALSSLAEVGYCMHAAQRLNYIDAATGADCERRVRQVAAPLLGLIKQQRGTRDS
jgi:four helix bundle protein